MECAWKIQFTKWMYQTQMNTNTRGRIRTEMLFFIKWNELEDWLKTIHLRFNWNLISLENEGINYIEFYTLRISYVNAMHLKYFIDFIQIVKISKQFQVYFKWIFEKWTGNWKKQCPEDRKSKHFRIYLFPDSNQMWEIILSD